MALVDLAMEDNRKIRFHIVVETEYSNSLMNYGELCKAKIMKVLSRGDFAYLVESGIDLPNPLGPINYDKIAESKSTQGLAEEGKDTDS